MRSDGCSIEMWQKLTVSARPAASATSDNNGQTIRGAYTPLRLRFAPVYAAARVRRGPAGCEQSSAPFRVVGSAVAAARRLAWDVSRNGPLAVNGVVKVMARAWGLFVALLLIGSAAPVRAQDTLTTAQLLRARSVRIFAPSVSSDTLVGHLKGVDRNQLVIYTRGARTVEVPASTICSVEVRVGLQKADAGIFGFLGGAVGGFFVFLLWANAAYENDEYNALGALLLGVPLGALTGAIIGIRTADPHWEPVIVREWVSGQTDQ